MSRQLFPSKLIEKLTVNSSNFYCLLTVITLIMGGMFQFIRPVLAEGTTASEKISNTATVGYTYLNSSEANILDQARSNTVELTSVEEVGITISSQGIVDSTGGADVTNDLLYYDFLFTGISKEPTRFFTLGQVTVTGPATVNFIAADLDGNGTTISSTGVYNQSGDQSPSNYKDNCSPSSNLPKNEVANTTLRGRDSNNNNTGTGPDFSQTQKKPELKTDKMGACHFFTSNYT